MTSKTVSQKHARTHSLLSKKEFNDPLWLDIKAGLDAAIQGKVKLWKPRVLKAK